MSTLETATRAVIDCPASRHKRKCGAELSCSASASDLDQDEVTLSHQWANDGNTISIEAQFVLDPSHGNKDDILTCTITAMDSFGDSITAQGTLTIANTPPTLQSISITPEAPRSNDLLTCNTLAIDADDDPLSISYSWTIDGVLQPETSSTFMASDVGDTITCTATVSDSELGNSLNASVEIINTAPTVDLVELPTQTPFTNDTVTANTVMSDIDGDVLTTSYDWYVDGRCTVDQAPSLVELILIKPRYPSLCNHLRWPIDLSSSGIQHHCHFNSLPTVPEVNLGNLYSDDEENLLCEILSIHRP